MKIIQYDVLTVKKVKSIFDSSFLTTRELEVLQLIRSQKSAVEIAEELFISHRAVGGHRNNLLLKTESRNVAGLAVYVFQNNIFVLF